MISPVTSTSVATKGAEETAGSAPSRFRMMGSMEPLRCIIDSGHCCTSCMRRGWSASASVTVNPAKTLALGFFATLIIYAVEFVAKRELKQYQS